MACALHGLTGNSEWEWGEEQQKAFDQLKLRICEEPVLAVPTDKGQFRVKADSSNFANGTILSQFINSKWRPIAFCLQSLSQTKCDYAIYDKEMLAIMAALDKWQSYLRGAAQPFEIWTDHLNLQYFQKPQKLNYRQAQ